jgi:hypothetical protein
VKEFHSKGETMNETTPPANSPAGKNPTEVEKKGRCRRCGRVLKNPAHAAAGIGPVCVRKAQGNVAHGG